MDVQLAEFAAEGEMLIRRDGLVAEEDHEMFGQRTVDLVDLAVGARVIRDQPADVDAGDLGADDRRQPVDGDGLIGRTVLGDVPIARPLLARERTHRASSSIID